MQTYNIIAERLSAGQLILRRNLPSVCMFVCVCVCVHVMLQECNQHASTALCGATALMHVTHLARCLHTCNTRAHTATDAATE